MHYAFRVETTPQVYNQHLYSENARPMARLTGVLLRGTLLVVLKVYHTYPFESMVEKTVIKSVHRKINKNNKHSLCRWLVVARIISNIEHLGVFRLSKLWRAT